MTDRPRALIVLIAVFLLGCLSGILGGYFWSKRSAEQPPPMMRNGREARGGQGRQRMTDLLGLTPEQERRFRDIMEESRRKLMDLQKEQMPKVEAIRNETNRRFLEVLSEEQRKKFEAFLKEWQARRERGPRGPELPPPPPRPPQ